MDFWQNSSTTIKAAIVGAAALAVLLLFILISNLGGEPTPDGGASVLTPVTTEDASAPEAPTTEPPTAAPDQAAAVADTTVNVRSGPSTDFPIIGMLLGGQSAAIVGRNADASWWAIDFPAPPDNQGWVAGQFVTATAADNAPIIEAPPVPAPTPGPPVAIRDWRGEYFANENLRGDPTLVRNDERIDFNWGSQPPADGMPATNWSARWTINRNLAAGTYRFSVWVDDGMRLFVDDRLIIDAWEAGPARNYTADINLNAGAHTARVEYFQGDGEAMIQVAIGYAEGFPDWRAEYFANPDLADAPTVVRNESAIDFDWGAAPPADGLPANNWSARWTRSYDLAAGAYTVNADVQGGVRVWLDDTLLIDGWDDQSARQLAADTGELDAGRHDLRVEYFKARGNGRLIITATEADGDPIPPRAVMQAPPRANVDEEVTFSAVGSEVASGSFIETIAWDFGDGTTGRGVTTTHTYTEPGIYNVVLTLTDDKGLSDSNSQQIRIMGSDGTPEAPQPPVAVIDAPTQAEVGAPVSFYAGNSQSISPIISFGWNFGDGTVADAVSVQKVYNNAGVFNVNLTVIDDQGQSSSAQQQITVQEGAGAVDPTPEATVEPTAEATDAPTDEATSEPTTESTPEAAPTDEATPIATVAPEGDLTAPPAAPVVVTVDGAPAQPVLVDGVPTLQIAANQAIQADAGGAVAADPDLVFTWDMGDGSPPLTGTVVQHSYSAPGTYEVRVDVDNGEETATTVWQVVVSE